MALKPTYNYILTVYDNEGNVVGKRQSFDFSIVEQSIKDVPTWIQNWEKENLIRCTQCDDYTMLSDVSYKDSDEEQKEPLCQDCIGNIIDGKQKLKEI